VGGGRKRRVLVGLALPLTSIEIVCNSVHPTNPLISKTYFLYHVTQAIPSH